MSGHSKWSNIKNKKGAEDARRAQIFTGLVKNIRLAAKNGGEPNSNPNLRFWVEKAKEANMPKDKIQRAIDIGSGKIEAGRMQEINYECFGPEGMGMIVMAVTDNNNRTSGELRAILTRGGGNLGGPGCTSYMFSFNKEKREFETIMPLAISDEGKEKLADLIEKISEIDGVEGVFVAMETAADEEN